MESNQNPSPAEPFALPESQAPQPVLSDNDKLLSGLAYVSQLIIPAVLPVILLVSEQTKHSAFVRYHAIQSLGALVATVVYLLAAVVVYVAASALLPPLVCLLWVLFLVPIPILIYYGYKAWRGVKVEIPYLTKFMRDNGWL